MTHQLHHKMGSPLRSKLIKPQGVILLISRSAFAMLLWRRRVHPELGTVWDVLPMAAVTLGMLIYAVVAGRMTYDIYSLSVGPALVFCLVCRDFYESSADFPI
jgi:Gpi18-like mannosyltransferase